jgi:uncharacterized membrane protein HdeD (DUF308 family)
LSSSVYISFQVHNVIDEKRESYMQSQERRPLGVTIIAILTLIGGIIFLASGLVLVIIGIGIILLALGIAYLVMAYGLWKGKGWAWTITLILSAIGIIVALVSIAAGNVTATINVIIHGVVIYYLYRPNVKAFFGK